MKSGEIPLLAGLNLKLTIWEESSQFLLPAFLSTTSLRQNSQFQSGHTVLCYIELQTDLGLARSKVRKQKESIKTCKFHSPNASSYSPEFCCKICALCCVVLSTWFKVLQTPRPFRKPMQYSKTSTLMLYSTYLLHLKAQPPVCCVRLPGGSCYELRQTFLGA